MADLISEEPVELTFWHERETRNCEVYAEESPRRGRPVVGMLYVRKDVAKEWGNPEALKVTIRPE